MRSLPNDRNTPQHDPATRRRRLVIDALADDVALWQAEAMQYRALAHEAIHALAAAKHHTDAQKQQLEALRAELRRYVRAVVGA